VKLTPIAEKTLRSFPSQVGQTVSELSVNDCWMSKAVSHSVQR
jgi:uncharacterized protein YneF (UPF0154 family)